MTAPAAALERLDLEDPWWAGAESVRSFPDGPGPDESFNPCIFSTVARWSSGRGPVPATREAIASAKVFFGDSLINATFIKEMRR